MIDLILPGYSDKNKLWLEETASNLKSDNEIRTMYWNHWTDVHKKFDAKEKAVDIIDVILDDFANIIAKSVGTLVASYMIITSPEKVKKVIFCGIPLNDLTDVDKAIIKKALEAVNPQNIICIQNDKDPHGSFEEVSKFVSEANPKIKIISKESDNHEYLYASDFSEFLGSF